MGEPRAATRGASPSLNVVAPTATRSVDITELREELLAIRRLLTPSR
jgi:hypothetical protein